MHKGDKSTMMEISGAILLLMVLIISTDTFGQFGAFPVGVVMGGEQLIGSVGPWQFTQYSAVYYPEGDKPSIGFVLPNRVKNAAEKKGLNNALLVLTQDNKVHLLTLYPQSDSVIGELGTVVSETWDKVVGDDMYALSSSNVSVSRDGGATWLSDGAGLPSILKDIDLDSAQYVYVAAQNGLYKQAPDSTIWHKDTTYPGSNASTIFIDRKSRIVVTDGNGRPFISTDGGASWSVDTAGLGSVNNARIMIINGFGDDAYGNLYIAGGFSEVYPEFLKENHLYKSAGGTGPWQQIDGGINTIAVRIPNFTSASGDSTLYAGTSVGLFKSTDEGNTWVTANDGIPAETFYGIARLASGRRLMSSALGIFYCEAGDSVWHHTYPQSGFQGGLPLYQDGSGNLYTTDSYLGVYPAPAPVFKSTDGGTTWQADTAGLSGITGEKLYIDETGAQHYASSNFASMLWVKTADGSWMTDTAGVSLQAQFNSMISDHNGYIYGSGSMAGAKTLRRPTGGGVWTPDTAGMAQAAHDQGNTYANYFTIMAAGPNGPLVGTSQYGVFAHINGTWNYLHPPAAVTRQYIQGISVDSNGTIFVAFNNLFIAEPAFGVYYTNDTGKTWTSAGMDGITVTRLASIGNSTYAFADGGGLYQIFKNGGTTGVKDQIDMAHSFSLAQNYPNPFNPSTIINYSVPARSHVLLKIYNALGQEVATLVNTDQEAGSKNVRWNAAGVSSGVYFYHLQVGTNAMVKKMVLVR